MTTRYAIYFVPERESDLFKNASQWLGWDCQNAVKIDQPTHPQIELSEITSSPKVYGFHATLKPPFELFGSLSEDDLLRAADKFSHAIKPIYELEFELNTLGSFLALTPKNRMSDIHRLAGTPSRAGERPMDTGPWILSNHIQAPFNIFWLGKVLFKRDWDHTNTKKIRTRVLRGDSSVVQISRSQP